MESIGRSRIILAVGHLRTRTAGDALLKNDLSTQPDAEMPAPIATGQI